MEDKEAIEILKHLPAKYPLTAEEKEAVLTAIGILGWTKLLEGTIKTRKAMRDRDLAD